MRAVIKRVLSRLFDKSGSPVVAVFVADDGDASRRMVERIREDAAGYPLALIAPPRVDRKAFPPDVEWVDADGAIPYANARRALARRWVGLAPVLLDGEDRWQRLLWAFLIAPRRVLLFHPGGESHPLRLEWPIASWRFLRGERLGDIFRPTAFWWLRDLGRWMRAVVLFAGWSFSRQREKRLGPPEDELSADRLAVIHLDKNDLFSLLDEALYAEDAKEIIVSTAPQPPSDAAIRALSAYLSRPGVFMVTGRASHRYGFGDRTVKTQDRESGPYCLGSESDLFAFRRDEYFELGGMAGIGAPPSARALQALCLRALMRGWKTVYAGDAEESPQPADAGEDAPPSSGTGAAELLIAAVDAPAAALKALRQFGGNAEFRRAYWRAVRSVRPLSAPGKATGELLTLAIPGASAFIGRKSGRRAQIGVLTPYFPYPLSHGGAIRIYNLLRHVAADFDIHLFAFAENETNADLNALLEHCSRVVLVKPPVWEVPRWITATPKGIRRYRVEQMRSYVEEFTKDFGLSLLQIEFTQLAFFGEWLRTATPKVLVEHDVTFDLHRQAVAGTEGWKHATARADAWRWRRFELSAIEHFERVITMSSGDRGLLAAHGVPESKLAIVENGIDLERFQASEQDAPEDRLLFIGSFRHFPNIRAYRLLSEEIWPRILAKRPGAKLMVVSGPDPELYWRKHFGEKLPDPPAGVELRGFVADVRPLYETSQVVAVPVPLSAGTNIKVLEALAMGRPVVSTTVGCAGLDLEDGRTVLIADDPADFAAGVLRLFSDQDLRRNISRAGRRHVVERFGWEALARKQKDVWEGLLEADTR